jgi:alginate O-acetyltransferase complex protein AlgI
MTETTDTYEVSKGKLPRWSLATLLVAAALSAKPCLPPWAFLWLTTAALFFSFKTLAVRGPVDWRWFFLWPGMDVRPFQKRRIPQRVRHWAKPLALAILGAVLIWVIARHATAPLLGGWIGMIGFILLLHFGGFHLLALAWRAAGIEVQPLMARPLASVTLAEFWGARWNRGFSDVARREVFWPLAPVIGARPAQLAVFLFSGLVHELVITVPDGVGYGLPTLYFLLQGAAATWQRAPAHRAWASGARGRLFTLFIAGAPAFWLFPPVWVERVFVPFLQVIHAL